MVICPHCQTVNHPGNVSCSGCGAPMGLDPALEGDPFIGRALGGGRFTLQAVVGSGELGMVYRGTDARTGQVVAIKIVHPDVAATHGDELLRSAGAVARLRHAKIATVLAAAREADGTTFIVTEFVEGETLREMLGRSGPQGPRRAADILFQLCSALAAFHRAGRPHGNLKPENVFLGRRDDGSDAVKIVDAGSPELFGVRETVSGHVIIGNPKYFSPEQVLGEPVGLASDIFTLGVIGYQLLSGALPFFGATPDQLLDAIVNGVPTPVEHRTSGTLPPLLATAIRRSLAKQPHERYPDLRALATDLAGVIKAVQAPPTPPRRSFGFGAQPSTVIADVNALSALTAGDDDDEDRTVARSLDDAALQAIGFGADEPVVVLENPVRVDDIPEPLMFTGALDGDLLQAAISEAASAVEGDGPGAGDPLESALQAAVADLDDEPLAQGAVPPRSIPPGDLPGLSDLGEVSGDFDPFSGMQLAAGPALATPKPKSAPVSPSPHLHDAILDAMDEVEPPARAPAASPLATAADFAAIAPESVTTSGALEALPPAAPTPHYGKAIALLALLLVIGGGAFVYLYVLDHGATETAGRSRRPSPRRGALAPPSAPDSVTPVTAASAGSAAAGSVASAGADAAPTSEPPAPPPLEVTLESTPKTVEIWEGDRKIGQTPFQLSVTPADPARTFIFKAKGYRDQKSLLDPAALEAEAGPHVIAVALKKKRKAVSPSTRGRTPPPVENPYKLENPY